MEGRLHFIWLAGSNGNIEAIQHFRNMTGKFTVCPCGTSFFNCFNHLTQSQSAIFRRTFKYQRHILLKFAGAAGLIPGDFTLFITQIRLEQDMYPAAFPIIIRIR